MAQITISVLKRAAFKDATQEWANTYVYASAGALPDAAAAEALIDEVVAQEKLFHSTDVTFVEGRCWSSGGTPASNEMIFQKALTGLGAAGTDSSLDRERAVLVQWPAGVDSLGRKVYLRKWYHPCGNFGTVAWSAGNRANINSIASSSRTAIANYADVLSRIGTPEVWGLVADSGRTRDGGILSATPPTAHKHLEHHQLGDQWRG